VCFSLPDGREPALSLSKEPSTPVPFQPPPVEFQMACITYASVILEDRVYSCNTGVADSGVRGRIHVTKVYTFL
jgi:hypothetical protein